MIEKQLELTKSRGEYPAYWQQGVIQWRLACAIGFRCEHCHATVNPYTNRTIGKLMRNGLENVIAIHHINGDKSNCHWTNLVYTCQTCHLEIQSNWAPGGILPRKWGGAPEWMTRRRLEYQEHPQLSLFEVVEIGVAT
jgi:hypothetical protein